MKQQHFETTLWLERKDAKKVNRLIASAGFIEITRDVTTGSPAKLLDEFRIVVYHENLKPMIQELLKKELTWVEKEV